MNYFNTAYISTNTNTNINTNTNKNININTNTNTNSNTNTNNINNYAASSHPNFQPVYQQNISQTNK
jgi:hypothetical protein